MINKQLSAILLCSLVVLVAACNNSPGLTRLPPTAAATFTPPNPTLPPTAPPVTTAPPTNTPLPQTGETSTVQIFLIAVEDKGLSGQAVGCGDSLVPVATTIPKTQGVLKAALNALLAIKQSSYGQSGLYNALYQSDLTLEKVSIESGRALIHLSGRIVASGVCDNPRIEAQLKRTALQFSTVSDVAIFVNGQPLEDILSQR